MRSECEPVHRPVERRAPRGVAQGRLIRLVSIASLAISLAVVGPGIAAAKDSPARKLGRGFGNLTLGVLAIPSEVIDTTRESGPAVGVTWGLIKGTGMMVATQAVGLWEVLTCPFATPPDYRPILKPEFPWQRFSRDRDSDRSRKERRAGSATAAGRAARE